MRSNSLEDYDNNPSPDIVQSIYSNTLLSILRDSNDSSYIPGSEILQQEREPFHTFDYYPGENRRREEK